MDSLNRENEIKMKRIALQSQIKDRTILDNNTQIANQKTIILNKNKTINVKDEEVDYWAKQYRKQKRQKFLVGGIGILLIVLVGI